MAFRAGGQGSIRGFDYGIQRGAAFWALGADASPWRWRVRPVFFADAGQAGPLGGLKDRPILVGGGVGLSFANGLVRFDLSHPITPRPSGAGLRFDLIFGASR
jgi:outer membrane translocation and assembly module TamA